MTMNIADPAPKPNKTAAALDNERRRLAAIVESSNDAIISENLDGIIVSWNSAAERIYGYSTEEVIGKHITEVIPTARDGEMLDLMLRVRRGEQVPSFEVRRASTESVAVSAGAEESNGRAWRSSTICVAPSSWLASACASWSAPWWKRATTCC